MSESEKRRCYFIQYSDAFLYDTKVQKLYGTPNTGKASIAVYLQLMLIAAKSGGFIVHDYPLYPTLGEQLQPLFLYTTKEEIDAVIHYFANPEFDGKYIHVIDDIYTFVQAKTMTESKTIGALNKAANRKNKKDKLEADNVRQLSANCPPIVGNNNTDSYIDNDNNTNTKQLLLAVGITDAIAGNLINNFGDEKVKESYFYAIYNMPSDVRTKTGFIIDCIKKQYKLSDAEKLKIAKKAELRATAETLANDAITMEEKHLDEEYEIERNKTFLWWETLTEQSRIYFWQLATNRLNTYAKQIVSNMAIPNDLATLPSVACVLISQLTFIRKEHNYEEKL